MSSYPTLVLEETGQALCDKSRQKYGDGRAYSFGEINIGGLNMKNMVKGYKTHKGLFLTQYLFFQGPNPNLMIPWEEFQAAEERRFLFIKRYRIPVGNPQVSYIDITPRKYALIADRLP